MGHLVDGDIAVDIPGVIGSDVFPGEDERPLFPGLAGQLACPLVEDPGLVRHRVVGDEGIGIHQHGVPAAQGIQGEVHQRQAGLGGDGGGHGRGDGEVAGALECLGVEEEGGLFTQTALLLGGEFGQQRPVLAHDLPVGVIDGVAREDAATAPVGQTLEEHGASLTARSAVLSHVGIQRGRKMVRGARLELARGCPH